MRLLFVSDTHLCPERPLAVRRFFEFLDSVADTADQLYILGDLFDYWLGDDMSDALYRDVTDAIAALAKRGIPVSVQHGNRDFLLGEAFATAASVTLLPDIAVLPEAAAGCKALAMHGDLLCTRDHDYQQLRRKFHSPDWQRDFLALPPPQRLEQLRVLRSAIGMQGIKPEQIVDVTPAAVQRLMNEHGAELLIHGHTHRPALHRVELERGSGRRAVLGAWEETGPSRCLLLADGRLEAADRP